MNKTTPLMDQWQECKKAAAGALLLFRLGDFYEAFKEDAVVLSKELDLTLTSRGEVPMSGIPQHTCEGYIDRLVAKGYRVALAEQTSDPKESKGLVKREVVRVVTPGTVINSTLLSEKNNNFIACITGVGSIFGLAILDLTTADLRVVEFDKLTDLVNEVYRLRPSEILLSNKFHNKHQTIFKEIKNTYRHFINIEEDWRFEHQIAYDFLANHFKVKSLDGFGLKGMVAAINATGALLHYLDDSLSLPINHITTLRTYSTFEFLSLDRTTQCNLELTHSLRDGSQRGTLLEILDRTRTPMGARLMHHWIKQPLLNVSLIKHRQKAISAFIQNSNLFSEIKSLLDGVRDIERLMMKISSGYAGPRDLTALRFSFEPIGKIKHLLHSLPSELIQNECSQLDELPEMTSLIARALVDEPPARLSDGNAFREGFHAELDELRNLSRDGKAWIARYQLNLRETLGIKTLKVGFNRMFGYYIEVSKGQAENMPDTFQRRQTLVNGERFISPELKEYEQKVMSAEEKMNAIESDLFTALRADVSHYAPHVLRVAAALAQIDTLHALADVALLHNYSCPLVDESHILEIHDGRHPVIEAINIEERFIPNDTVLDNENNRLLLITGPNMAGKSTYIRQVALIVIMAQIGSFVPAKAAHIGLVDKVFTRIGASDDLTRGLSTFMVEMTETANILNNATTRSLVILDEIGRGTSTYDGISIAWAVAEHLLTTENQQAKTLFATHYWELTKLEEKIPGAVNYHVAVHESEDHIVFLRKIIKGNTDKSYGIHVARLAGLPLTVIDRAKEILLHLEENANRKSAFEPSQPQVRKLKPKAESNVFQLSLFG